MGVLKGIGYVITSILVLAVLLALGLLAFLAFHAIGFILIGAFAVVVVYALLHETFAKPKKKHSDLG